MKYGIIGTGALGGYYGGKLAKAGKDVHFLFHSDYDEVKQNGLRIDSVKGDFILNPINAYNDSKDMPQCDVVLVCLKTTNNRLLKEVLPPLLHSDTTVILIQNGLGMEKDVQSDFPDLKIAGGIAFICARKDAPAHVEHLDEGRLNIGAYSETNKLKLLNIASDFEESDVEAEIVDLNTARWEKLLWNIPFNGLSVVLNTSTDKLLADQHTRQLIYDIMQEVIRAANKCDAHIKPKAADSMIDMTKHMVPYSPSMKLDFDHKRSLEILYIYTKPIAEAVLAGEEMPRVQMLAKQLSFIQAQYIK